MSLKILFPIEGTTLTLVIHLYRLPLDKTALREAIYNAYTFVSNVIDISGDGDLPVSSDPYEVSTRGAFIRLDSDIQAHKKLKWSDVKEILWGLRKFMVVQGNSFRLIFLITQDGQTDTLGFGRVLEGKPLHSPFPIRAES